MSSEFERRMKTRLVEAPEFPEHVIWRLSKNGRFAEARMPIVLIGSGRPELRIYVQHPTPEFQLLWSMVTTAEERLDTLARQQRQLFKAKGWSPANRHR